MTVKIEGLRELDRALAKFTKSTARGVLNRALKKAAAPIADEARQNAPFDTGELKNSIGVEVTRTGGAGRAAFAEAMRGGASRSEAGQAARAANRAASGQPLAATVSVVANARHAIFAEFGMRQTPGTMFLSNAMRGRAKEALAVLKTELGTEITKTAKRVAARRAKKVSTK